MENKSRFLQEDCFTVQIYMWRQFNNYSNIEKIICISDIQEVGSCTLKWKICNLKTCLNENKVLLFPNEERYNMQLRCCNNDQIKVAIDLVGYERYLKVEIYLRKHSTSRKELISEEYKYDDIEEAWELDLCSITNIKQYEDIILYFRFTFLERVCNYLERHLENLCCDKSDKPVFNSLLYDFRNMYIDKKLTDLKFSVDNKFLTAHKYVLASRSPVFAKMLEQEMLEKKENIICIQDMSYDTLDDMLLFLYVGEMEDLNYEKAIELINAAEKYQIGSLKHECSAFLQSCYSAENFYELVKVSNMLNDNNLKMAGFEYFKVHRKDILVSEDWKTFKDTHNNLALEILTIFALDM